MQQHAPHCTKDTASLAGTVQADCVPHFMRSKPWHMSDLPWKDAVAREVTPIIVLGKSHLETLDFEPPALKSCKKRQLVRLFLLYRELGLEPVILADILPDSMERKKADGCTDSCADSTADDAKEAKKANDAQEDHVKRFLKKALLMGGRVTLVPPGKSLWQVITHLCSGNILLHPANFPFVRKCGIVLLLHEAAKRAGIKQGTRKPCRTRPLAPSLDGLRGWPAYLDRETLQQLANGNISWNTLPKEPLFETADSFAVRDCNDILLQEHLSKELFYESLEEGENWLNKRDAKKILELMPLPLETRAHVAAVSRAAMAIAQRMRLAGCSVNPELAASAALLHDIAKGFRHHEKTGAHLLWSLGLSQMAHCIADHRDLVLADDKPATEREVVYLADKYCLGDSFVPLEVRFGQKTELYAREGRSFAGIKKRLQHAKALEARLTRELGVSPETIVRIALSRDA